MNNNVTIKFSLALLLAVAAPVAGAQATAPDVLLKSVTAEVITIIRQDKDIQAGVPAKVAEVVETRILPLFDAARGRAQLERRHARAAEIAHHRVQDAAGQNLFHGAVQLSRSGHRLQAAAIGTGRHRGHGQVGREAGRNGCVEHGL